MQTFGHQFSTNISVFYCYCCVVKFTRSKHLYISSVKHIFVLLWFTTPIWLQIWFIRQYLGLKSLKTIESFRFPFWSWRVLERLHVHAHVWSFATLVLDTSCVIELGLVEISFLRHKHQQCRMIRLYNSYSIHIKILIITNWWQ